MTAIKKFHIEDAIALTKFGKFNFLLIFLSGVLISCGFLETSSVSIILPLAQCEFNLSNAQKGLLGSVGYIGSILSSHLWGFLADTKGRKIIIVPTLLLTFLCSLLSTLSTNYWVLAGFRFLNGFFICAPQTIVYAFLGEFHSVQHRSRVLVIAAMIHGIVSLLNICHGMLYINNESFSFYIPFLDIDYGPWRIYLLFCSIPTLLSGIIMMLFIPESPKFTFSQGNEAKTIRTLQKIYRINTGNPADDFVIKEIVEDEEVPMVRDSDSKGFFYLLRTQTLPLFQKPHLGNLATACYLQFGLCVATNGFYTFFPEISNKVTIWLVSHLSDSPSTVCGIFQNFDKVCNSSSIVLNDAGIACVARIEFSTFENIAILLILFSGLGFVTSLIVNRVGKLVIITSVMFVAGVCSLILMYLPFPRLAIYLYLVVMLTAINVTIVNASTVELFPTNLRAMAVSISMMSGRLGSCFGSIFVGLLINNFCIYTWLLPAFLSITGGFLTFTIPNINRKIK